MFPCQQGRKLRRQEIASLLTIGRIGKIFSLLQEIKGQRVLHWHGNVPNNLGLAAATNVGRMRVLLRIDFQILRFKVFRIWKSGNQEPREMDSALQSCRIERFREDFPSATGVRPSAGAARSKGPDVFEQAQAPATAFIAAPGDGRTPVRWQVRRAASSGSMPDFVSSKLIV